MSKVVSIRQQERRKDFRRQVQLEARLNGWPTEIVDISLSGVGIGESDKITQQSEDIIVTEPVTDFGEFPMNVGDVVNLEIFLPGEVELKMKMRIVRKDLLERNIGGRFTSLGKDNYSVIESLVTGRVQKEQARRNRKEPQDRDSN